MSVETRLLTTQKCLPLRELTGTMFRGGVCASESGKSLSQSGNLPESILREEKASLKGEARVSLTKQKRGCDHLDRIPFFVQF
ncbi:hypothetical protein A8990_1602 [Paenibacillus taihuensis]|uniref:Uncharacterized protein n=1 Tax=Paenibacillus taihuensis TaxID=1156355 RepID=A0A3D9Q0T3_9BACL|nr:hypothetical protein A8990_1602 [Paenibacillus taihuensis]